MTIVFFCSDSDGGLPDDDDLTDDDDEEYASWKMRELKRIKGEAERREALVQEKLDIERRRAMTEEERMAEDTKLGKFREKEKKKWKYLQKYYHKGVFYMDDKSTGQVGTSVLASSTGTGAPSSSADYYSPGLQDKQVEDEAARKAAEKKLDARLRDYSGATLEDTYNREKLPEVLQVKKFGMRGRTKYTHLVDQDTTKFGPDSLGKDRNVQSNYLQKRSGVGDIDSAGRRKKKRDNL
jgi:microfibrillar-associated protein 1